MIDQCTYLTNILAFIFCCNFSLLFLVGKGEHSSKLTLDHWTHFFCCSGRKNMTNLPPKDLLPRNQRNHQNKREDQQNQTSETKSRPWALKQTTYNILQHTDFVCIDYTCLCKQTTSNLPVCMHNLTHVCVPLIIFELMGIQGNHLLEHCYFL